MQHTTAASLATPTDFFFFLAHWPGPPMGAKDVVLWIIDFSPVGQAPAPAALLKGLMPHGKHQNLCCFMSVV